MRERPISEKKQKLISAKIESELVVGESISVYERAISTFKTDSDKTKTCTIESLDNGKIIVFEGSKRDKRPQTAVYEITKDDIHQRSLWDIGADPFEANTGDIRPINYSFDSILFTLDVLGNKRDEKDRYDIEGIQVMEANWNPFIYKDGKKMYYQRQFVWEVSDKQLLIESIYQNIDCGKILVRNRGWEELRAMQKNGETELSWRDIVDGKQRLNAVKCFMQDEFTDLQGNYYSDLSFFAQHKLENHQLFSYAEMPENTKDADVIKQFLKLNHAGVPQSLQHIEFVKSLLNK